jgi:hypothetical protein
MRVVIHQPNYIPWIGFFSKLSLCDTFVIMDSVDFPNRGIIHRNKIRMQKGGDWLTIPIEKKYIGKRIDEVLLPSDPAWIKKHWVALIANYSKSPFFQDHKQQLYDIFFKDPQVTHLRDFNEEFIRYIADFYHIQPKFVRTSEMNLDITKKKTDFIVDILKAVGCTQYFSGSGGAKEFLDDKQVIEAGIQLFYTHITPVQYPQRWPGFEPYMSGIDLLFNLNQQEGRKIIDEMHHESLAESNTNVG